MRDGKLLVTSRDLMKVGDDQWLRKLGERNFMGWINLVSTRSLLRHNVRNYVEKLESATQPPDLGSSAFAGLYALLSDERDLFARVTTLALPLLDNYQSSHRKSSDLVRPMIFPDLVALLVMASLVGDDRRELWSKIGGAKPAAKSSRMSELHKVTCRIAGARPDSPGRGQPGRGAVGGESQWLKLLKTAPTRALFDLAISPDSRIWTSVLRTFVFPLGLLLSKELTESGGSVDPFELFKIGSYPERHPRVLYERQYPRPDFGTEPRDEQPESWAGFDAVEVSGNELLAYHYVGLKWKAPLLFDRELNAFQFLDQLDKSWELVERQVSSERWEEIERHRKAGHCRHVVVYDENEASCPPEDLQRAAQHYGVNLRARDVTEV
jgi:hypothetical protein